MRPDGPDDVTGGGLDDGVPGDPLLVGVPRRRVEGPPFAKQASMERMTSGGSSRPRRNSSTSTPVVDLHPLPAAVHQDQAGAPLPEGASRGGRDDPPNP